MINTQSLLDEYKTYKTKPSFFKDSSNNENLQLENYNKNQCIRKYVTFVSSYFNVKINNQQRMRCKNPECLKTDFKCIEDGSFECVACHAIIIKLNDTPTFKENDKTTSVVKYQYSQRAHLLDAIKYHQGQQSIVIEDKVYDYVKEQMRRHSIKIEDLTREDILLFFSNHPEYSKNYTNINLIYSEITKTPPPDIRKYEKRVLELHDEYTRAYEEVKDEERKNSQNIYFILFKLLQIANAPINMNDFYSLKTIDKMDEHNDKFNEVRIKCGWKNYPSFLSKN